MKSICKIAIAVCFSSALKASAVSTDLVTIAWENTPRTIDPRFTIDAYSHYLSDLQHCSLINFGEDGQIIGELAKSWKWDSNTKLTVTMKPEAVFSDGTPVTAKDVKATYDFFKREDLKKPSPLAGAFKKINKVEPKGKHQVIFHFNEPEVSFLQNLMIGILPEKDAKKELIETPGTYKGCGPFILTKSDVTGLSLVANPKYSAGPVPKISAVQIKIVKDELTRFSKLRKGEIDLVQDRLSRDQVAKVAKSYPKLTVEKRAGLSTTYLGFNMRDKILAKKEVRRAIALAINREQIIKYILNDMAVPAATMLTPEDPFRNKSVAQVPFDPALAKQILDKAGFKDPDGDGKQARFSLTYKTTTNVTRVTIAQAIASQLRKIGIDVTVKSLEWGKFKADVDKGAVQLWSLTWAGFKDPDIYRYAFASESFPPNGGNRGWYQNKRLDKMLAEANITADVEKRKALYDKVQTLIAEEQPYVFLWHEETFAVLNKRVKGFKLYADGRLSSLKQVQVEK